MLLDVEHRLRFDYDDFMRESWLELRVQPRSSPDQTVHSFSLAVGPPAPVTRYADWNDNLVHHFGVADYHDRIEVVARSLVEVHPTHPALGEVSGPPADPAGPLLDLTLFGGPVLRTAALEALLRELSVPESASLGEQIAGLGALVRTRFEYRPGVTHFASTTDEVLQSKAGVCQDFAHLMLGLLRLRRIPCRYVSGYLHLDPSDAPAQSHAWVEALAKDGAWAAFDPTHDRVPAERYVVVARGRHYDDVPPNRGVYRGNARETLHAEVHTSVSAARDVAGLHEQIEDIAVPVYREIPHRAAGPVPSQAPESQQQQQQQ